MAIAIVPTFGYVPGSVAPTYAYVSRSEIPAIPYVSRGVVLGHALVTYPNAVSERDNLGVMFRH